MSDFCAAHAKEALEAHLKPSDIGVRSGAMAQSFQAKSNSIRHRAGDKGISNTKLVAHVHQDCPHHRLSGSSMLQEEACEEALKCNDTEVDGQHIRVERCKSAGYKGKGGEAGAASDTSKPPAPKKPAQKVHVKASEPL